MGVTTKRTCMIVLLPLYSQRVLKMSRTPKLLYRKLVSIISIEIVMVNFSMALKIEPAFSLFHS